MDTDLESKPRELAEKSEYNQVNLYSLNDDMLIQLVGELDVPTVSRQRIAARDI
jgi:hypothetical protein